MYAPRRRDGYDLDVFVLGRTLARDSRSPIVWVFSTIGLCTVEQGVGGGKSAFRHFELALATNNSEREDPFPSRLGVVLDQGAALPGWDWSQVTPPPLLDWLVIAGEELGSLTKGGSTFAIADMLTIGPGGAPWTRSILNRSVLLPAPPPMLAAGLAPFDTPSDGLNTLQSETWHRDPGANRFAYGFYWLLPVSEREYAAASQQGTWNMFADLAALAAKEGRDDWNVAFDLLRP